MWFNNHKDDYSATVLKYVKNLQWEDAIVTDGNIGKVLEIPFSFEDNLSVSNKNANLHNDHHRLMFVKDDFEGYKLFYVQIFTDSEKSKILDRNYNYYNISNDFTGKVFVQELSTGIGNRFEFRNGNKIITSLTSRMREEYIDCVWLGYWYADGSFVPTKLLYCEGSGGEEAPTPGYGGGGTTPQTPAPTPAPVVIRIIDNLTGKAKCINTLLNKSGNSFVQKLLAKFEGKSEFDIAIISVDKVISKETGLEINGDTFYPGSGSLINIQISNSRVDATAGLEGARIILHEYVHADMYRKVYTTDMTAVDAKDFKKVFEKYEENYHSSMATLYVNSMRDALKEFHKNVLTDDYNKYVNYYGVAPSDAFYEAMAWGGLRDEKVKAWTDLSADKKTSIESLAKGVTSLTKTVTCPN